jgi:carbonic anhydrase
MTSPLVDRREFVRLGAFSAAGALLLGCRPSEPCPAPPAAAPRKVATMTKEWQQALTPQENVAATAGGQHPAAVILSCIDSRAPAEIILDSGIGDMFNARIAGNFVDRDLAGSMEFATAVAGAKVVLVMGHTSCGAIKGAISGAKLGNLTALLEKLTPAVKAVKDVSGPRTAANAAFVDAVATENVRLTLQEIRKISPVLAGLEKDGKILMAGAMYHVESGEVQFLA